MLPHISFPKSNYDKEREKVRFEINMPGASLKIDQCFNMPEITYSR